MNMKFIVIIPYFGKLPNYFPLWLNSCKYNKEIDWMLFLDDKTNYKYPPNVKPCYCTLKDVEKLLNDKLGMKLCIYQPYKLCDYKPLYGKIFIDYIKGYDYWGYGDLDVIYGNIEDEILKAAQEKADKIFLLGHLSLIKSDLTFAWPEANKEIENVYRIALQSKKNYGLDEFFFNRLFYIYNKKLFLSNKIADIEVAREKLYLVIPEMHSDGQYEFSVDTKNGSLIFNWHKGKLFGINNFGSKEYLYVHFQKRTMKMSVSNCSDFFITEDGFFNDVDNVRKKFPFRVKKVFFLKKSSLIKKVKYWQDDKKYKNAILKLLDLDV